MFGTANRLLRVATSSPARSDARGDGGLVSLALAGAVLAEIALCGIIIARVACERAFCLPASTVPPHRCHDVGVCYILPPFSRVRYHTPYTGFQSSATLQQTQLVMVRKMAALERFHRGLSENTLLGFGIVYLQHSV